MRTYYVITVVNGWKSTYLVTNDFEKARRTAWELECKGISAYYE